MKILIVLGLLTFYTPCFAGNQTDFELFVSSPAPSMSLPASKLTKLHDDITLRKIVVELGPGWVSSHESAGIIAWFFEDGSKLYVWPSTYSENEIISFRGKSGRSKMWIEK